MGEYAIVPNVPTRTLADPDQERAALRAVLRRYETGQLTAAETRTVLAVLGLDDNPAPLRSARQVRDRELRKAYRQRARDARAAGETPDP